MRRDKNSSAAQEGHKPVIRYWHVWRDEDGVSHQTRCALTGFERESMGGAAAQWNDRQPPSGAMVLFTVLPIGWIGEWHENPRPQWIVPLSGRWFVESMDGTRAEMGVGELSFGGDQDCVADADGRKGHRSGTLGDEPAVLMLVQLDEAPRKPCSFT
ncbi:MAG: cupin domain-containing protein [Casimicrobiaceae bacterium]